MFTCFRNQKDKTEYISNKSRRKQHNTGRKNKQGVKQIFSGHYPLLKAGTDTCHGMQTLDFCQVGTGKPGGDYNNYCIQRAYDTADFNQEIYFNDRYERKCKEEF